MLEGRAGGNEADLSTFYMKSALAASLCMETDSKTSSRKMWEVLTATSETARQASLCLLLRSTSQQLSVSVAVSLGQPVH